MGRNILARPVAIGQKVMFLNRRAYIHARHKEKIFIVKVVKGWKRLPRDVIDAPSLETFKIRLDVALSNLI